MYLPISIFFSYSIPFENENAKKNLSFSDFVDDKEARRHLLLEAAVYKVVNRQKYLEISQNEAVQKDDVIVSLLADLQQEQDQESEKMVNEMQDKVAIPLLGTALSVVTE